MGGIGTSLAKKAQALGMKVVYHNRRRLSREVEKGVGEMGVEYRGWEELLREADVLSLNLPLTEGTRGVLGKRELGMMKRGSVVVNTARGAVVDEAALVEYVFFFLPPSPTLSSSVLFPWVVHTSRGPAPLRVCGNRGLIMYVVLCK